MDPSLADDLLLLAYDDTGRAHRPSTDIECALAGALLVDLTLARRIDVADGKLAVLDDAPIGDAESDAALERIAGEDKPRKPEWWIDKLRSGLRKRTLDSLTERGWLRVERGRTLGIFPARRYVPVQGATAVRGRLEDAIVRGAEPDDRTAALAALLGCAGLARHTFPDVPRRELDARVKELGEGQWAGDAVRKAIQAVQAAVVVTTTVAATTAATAGS